MSLETSIKRVKKPIAKGLDRKVYYSKKYNVIIKKEKLRPYHNQFQNELNLFKKMDASEKYLFPVIAFYEEEKVTVMKRARMLNPEEEYNYRQYYNTEDSDYLKPICSNSDAFDAFVQKYGIVDLHSNNVGIIDNELVVIDAGLFFC